MRGKHSPKTKSENSERLSSRARKFPKREKERGFGPLVAAHPKEVHRPPREPKGVADLGERGKGEWKRVVMVFVVGGHGGVGF